MKNPWLEIPLDEYEQHMSLPAVDQARLLSEELASAVRAYGPKSVAVLGCAGGNGLEQLDPQAIGRVVAVDINPAYVATVRKRFGNRFAHLEAYVADVQDPAFAFKPVELLYAALLLEYVDVPQALRRLAVLCVCGGVLTSVIQLPSSKAALVSPSPFASVQSLTTAMRPVSPSDLEIAAASIGFSLLAASTVSSPGGRLFAVHSFRLQRSGMEAR